MLVSLTLVRIRLSSLQFHVKCEMWIMSHFLIKLPATFFFFTCQRINVNVIFNFGVWQQHNIKGQEKRLKTWGNNYSSHSHCQIQHRNVTQANGQTHSCTGNGEVRVHIISSVKRGMHFSNGLQNLMESNWKK